MKRLLVCATLFFAATTLLAQQGPPKSAPATESVKIAGKAIIALARKFLSIIYKTLKNNWIFTDFPQFVHVNG